MFVITCFGNEHVRLYKGAETEEIKFVREMQGMCMICADIHIFRNIYLIRNKETIS